MAKPVLAKASQRKHRNGADPRRDNRPRETMGQPSAVKRAIELIGGQAEVARRLKLTQPTIWGWVDRGRCPAERVAWLSQHSGVPRSELRPDLYRKGE